MICPRCGLRIGTNSLSRCPQCGQPLQAPLGQPPRITRVQADREATEQDISPDAVAWPDLYQSAPVETELSQEAPPPVFRLAEDRVEPSRMFAGAAEFFSPGLSAVRRRNILLVVVTGVVLLGLVLGSVLYLVGTHSPSDTSHGRSHSQGNDQVGVASSSTATASVATSSPTASSSSGGAPTVTSRPAATATTPGSAPTVAPTATSTVVVQTINVGGTVSNISLANNTFVVTDFRSGVSHTIDVNSGTQWIPDGQGGATSLATLQPGSDARVTCTVQPDGSCLASKVSNDT